MVSNAGLFFIVMLLGLCSCKNKTYTSVFDYDFTTKSDLKKYGFESMREDNRKMKQRMKDNGFPNPVFIPDEDVWDGWLIKKVDDTIVSFVFNGEKLSHSIIKIIKNGQDTSTIFNHLRKQGFAFTQTSPRYALDTKRNRKYKIFLLNQSVEMFISLYDGQKL